MLAKPCHLSVPLLPAILTYSWSLGQNISDNTSLCIAGDKGKDEASMLRLKNCLFILRETGMKYDYFILGAN